MISYKKSGVALWVMCAALGPAPLYAQEAAPKGSSSAHTDQSGAVQEIIVTAQKRRQSVNSVGMSITAVTGTQLAKQGVTDVAGLSKLDPSFVASQSFYGTPVYTIRGIGYNDYALAATPTVSVYSDEVPYPSLALTKSVSFDLDRVEVLKGPQGTLFGQNATGGAVNYIDSKPTSDFAAAIGTSYDNWGKANVHGFISGPIAPKLTGRLAFDVNEGGAWQTSNSRPGDHLGDANQLRLRGILDYQATDKLKVSLTANVWQDKSDTLAGQQIGLVPSNPGTYPNTPFANPALAGRTYTSIVGLHAVPLPTSDTQAEWAPNTSPRMNEHFYQFSGRVEDQLTDQMLLTVLGSFENYNQSDLTYNSASVATQDTLISGRVVSQYLEARLSGQAFDKRLEWLAGADYGSMATHEGQLTQIGTTAQFALIQLPVLFGGHQYLNPFTGTRNVSSNDNWNEAAFGNLEYHLTPKLSVHAGARYTMDTSDNSSASHDVDGLLAAGYTYLGIVKHIPGPFTQGSILTVLPNGHTGVYQERLKEHNVSWRVGADWKPVPGTLAYVTVSKGYKSGTYPTLPASVYVQLNPVRQESVLAYEIGTKTRLDHNRLQIDGALFYYDYKNKQLYDSVPDPLGIFGVLNALVNIPTSEEKGAELSVRYRPIPQLTLRGSATYLDSAVTGDFTAYNPYSLATTINLKGEPFPNTPKWSAIAGGQYNWNVFGGRYDVYFGADVNYVGRSQGQFGNASAVAEGNPSLEINSYATLDLRLGVDSADGHWSAQLFGRNVTNRYYWTQATHIYDTAVRFAGMPATYGGSIEYRF